MEGDPNLQGEGPGPNSQMLGKSIKPPSSRRENART
jgi:hypothetical protein